MRTLEKCIYRLSVLGVEAIHVDMLSVRAYHEWSLGSNLSFILENKTRLERLTCIN